MKKKTIILTKDVQDRNYARSFSKWLASINPENENDMRFWLYHCGINVGIHHGSLNNIVPKMKEMIRKHIKDCIDVLAELEEIKGFELKENNTNEKEN